MKTKKISDVEKMDLLTKANVTYTYSPTWSLNNIYLNIQNCDPAQFYPGDRLRFYGTRFTGNPPYITVVFADGSKPYLVDNIFVDSDQNGNYPSAACVEVLLDEVFCEKLNNSKKEDPADGNMKTMLQVQGSGFTLTKITRVPFK
jgi:hypothetical protein